MMLFPGCALIVIGDVGLPDHCAVRVILPVIGLAKLNAVASPAFRHSTKVKVDEGNTVARPSPNPTRDGYTFAGWFKEAAGITAWNFDDAITAPVTIYAKWDDNSKATIRYKTVPYGSANFGENASPNFIKSVKDGEPYVLVYSAKDATTHYYLYYMGYISSVPIAYKTAYRYNGVTPITIVYEKSWHTEESIMESMTTTKDRTWETNASAKVGVEVGGEAGIPLVAKGTVKASFEATVGGSYGETVSTSSTWETTRTRMQGESESISATIGENNEAPGMYRYALFGITDVFCLFKVDPTTREILSQTIVNCGRENSYAWGIDFEPDEHGTWGKTGDGPLFDIPDVDFLNMPAPTELIEDLPEPPPTTATGYMSYNMGDVIQTANRIGGGDDEIDSKNGQKTIVTLNISIQPDTYNPSLNVYRSIKINYTYTVKEGKSNWSELQFIGSKTIPLDFDLIELTGYTNQTYSGDIWDKHHDWVSVISNGSNLLRWLSVKIDGSGNDLNNIGFNATLNINYVKKL